jgi:hypothetical protein
VYSTDVFSEVIGVMDVSEMKGCVLVCAEVMCTIMVCSEVDDELRKLKSGCGVVLIVLRDL